MSERPEKARIVLWGKGYRVSQDSEEFQRWVPRKSTATAGSLEAVLDTFSEWPSLLQQLYSANDRDVTLLRCALIRNREIMCCAFAKTVDRHNRPSAVAVAASAPVDWNEDVAVTIARAHSLASRLAAGYAVNVRGNPEHIAAQLKNGTFVQDAVFDLEMEPANADDWREIIRAVKEWNGVSGVASPRLASLGANVVIGTKHEAEQTQGRVAIDGYYDVRDRAIHHLTDNLTRWQPALTSNAPAPTPPSPGTSDNMHASPEQLTAINESLQDINQTLQRLTQTMFEYVQRVNEILFGDPKRRRR